MGLGVKLLNILGGQKKKMKEKKSESFSFFRKTGSRYSFTSDKKKQDSNHVQVQRLSWSSFPVIKTSAPEETAKPTDLPSRLSRSSENLKKQAKVFNGLSKSKSSSLFKSSSNAVKNILTFSSSSPASSSSSSTSSSPKIRQSWSSGVTNILEKIGGDTSESNTQNPYDIKSYTINENQSLSQDISRRDIKNPITSYSRNYFLPTSVMEEENEGDLMCTPKIICVHKKTPDATRKSRRQIIQELEYIKELGMLPEEMEPIVVNNIQKNENFSSPNYENCSYGLENFKNSFRGYKASENSNLSRKPIDTTKDLCVDNNSNLSFTLSKQDVISTHSEADSSQSDIVKTQSQSSISDISSNSSCSSSSSSTCTINGSYSSTNSECKKFLNSSASVSVSKLVSSCTERELDTSSDSNEHYPTYVDNSTLNPPEASSLSSSVVDEDSEYDDSETMTTVDENESFETRLEDDLEKFDERRNSQGQYLETGLASDEEDVVQLRRKSKPNLHIDIDKAKVQKTLSNDRIKRLTEDGSDSARSSRSSPRTPRSPAIDIDVLFKQRQKKIEESTKDNLTQAKDLAQRLRLSTQSSPSQVEWLNGIRNKTAARQLAEVMSPVVLENPEGVFQLREADKDLTDEQREKNVTKALVWIKEELAKMKEQDQVLARQLVSLQLEMQRLRLHRSCTQHEALLEEVTCEEEEQKAFMTSTDLIDPPNNFRDCAFLPLRDFGVTRMNIANRRFTLR